MKELQGVRAEAESTDPAECRFTATWRETAGATGESRFYLPASFDPAHAQIQLTPAGRGWKVEPIATGSKNYYLTVAALGRPETASSRLTLTQAFNSLGTTAAPWFGSALILAGVGKSGSPISRKTSSSPIALSHLSRISPKLKKSSS